MMNLQKVKLADLQPHPMNYNTHPEAQLVELEKSLESFQQFKNIVVCQNTILAGHGLVEAAKRQGIEELDAVVMDDLTGEQQKALLVADNATPFLAVPDTDMLQELLDSMGEIDIPGVNDDWLNQFDFGTVVEIDDISFDTDKKTLPMVKIEVSELEYDSLRRDITEVLKGYESAKFV